MSLSCGLWQKIRILKSTKVEIASYDKHLYLSKTYQYVIIHKLRSSLVSVSQSHKNLGIVIAISLSDCDYLLSINKEGIF